MSRSGRAASTLVLLAGFSLAPSRSWAAETTPTVFSYGFDGFWTGAQVGLAAGYLATGKDYASEEWRTLVFGAGVGALVGVGVGITLGVVDVGSGPPDSGRVILRDTGYGVGLGAIVGTAVGALFLIDDGRTKNLVTGAAIGAVAGAGVGLVFGLVESATASSEPQGAEPTAGQLSFVLLGSEASLWPLPGVEARF
jgi:hypothetical protein